ncbi:MAG: gamma-glutamyltransferase [Pseudomonadota bacterium]
MLKRANAALRNGGPIFLLLWVFAAHSAEIPGHAVASAHPLATQAGIEVLSSGGNAFDAAVAVSAALAVVEPSGSGLGGGGFWLLRRADGQPDVFVDGRETAPLAAREDMYVVNGVADAKRSRDGALAAAIPGLPAGLDHLAQRYGRLPLSVTLAPAIRYARDGFRVDLKLHKLLWFRRSALRESPAATAAVLRWGVPVLPGMTLRQPALATVLERLAAKGAPGFYQGETAALLLAGVRAGGGIWTQKDLDAYRVAERTPLTFAYGAYRVASAPPPSAGGVALAQALQQLEALPQQSPVSRHAVIESLRRAFRDRAEFLGDPDFVSIPLKRLASREYARTLARGISPEKATPSSQLPPSTLGHEGDNTTHFSVLDRDGNAVAGTLSINLPFGSGFMAPGTGIFLNNEMDDFSAQVSASNAYGLIGSRANAIAPGKRPLSSMSPTFVDGPDGTLILGTPGGSRIISMVLLGVLGYTEGLNAQQIVDLPRYHHQYLPDEVQFEPEALSTDEQATLKKMGHTLKALDAPYGNMHVVRWDQKNKRLEAASDARGVGAAQVKSETPGK